MVRTGVERSGMERKGEVLIINCLKFVINIRKCILDQDLIYKSVY